MLCTFTIVGLAERLPKFNYLHNIQLHFECTASAFAADEGLPKHNKTCTMESRENNIWLHNSQCRCMWKTRVLIVFGMRRPPRLNTSKCSCINGNRSHLADHEILIIFILACFSDKSRLLKRLAVFCRLVMKILPLVSSCTIYDKQFLRYQKQLNCYAKTILQPKWIWIIQQVS